jgi:hypothetical protein
MSTTQVNQTTTGDQSPPKMLLLNDGRVLYVWTNNATADTTTVELQARIFNADGTPATNQIDLASLPAVDGTDGYDWDNLDLDLLPDGRVVVSYVRSTAETGGDEPVFTVLTPGSSSLAITTPATEIQSSDTTGSESPPITTVLDNGNVLFVWSNNALSDDVTSMHVEGRIYNPTTGTWATPDFRIGNVAIDGSDGADIPNMSVIQLAGGNVVVGWARNNAETGGSEPVYTVLNQNGATVFSTAELEGTDTESQWTIWESPPVLHALPDGRFLALWINDGYSNNSASMTLEGRIFHADGTPATGDFPIGSLPVDGWDGYDTEHLSVVTLDGGRVAIAYPAFASEDTHAHVTIIDTATNGTPVATDVQIPEAPDQIYSGPATLVALGESGYFAAVFAEGEQAFSTPTGLNYRIFDSNGTPVTGDISIVAPGSSVAMSGADGFDWNQFQAIYNPSDHSLVVTWVAASDGNGTGSYSSGPISMVAFIADGIVDGTAAADTILPDWADADGDSVDGGDGNDDVVQAGAGNDTVFAGDGDDLVVGEDGDDLLLGGADHDTLDGGTGNDHLHGDAGNDQLIAGDGDDQLSGNAGNDTLSSGSGNDLLILDLGGGADTVTDFDFGDSDADGRFNDQLDVSALDDGTGRGITVWNTQVQDLGNGSSRLVFPQGEAVTLQNVPAASLTPATLHGMGIPCFSAGTLIDTPTGPIPVERLRPGDLIVTRDNGPQPLRWVAMRRLGAAQLQQNPALQPIRVAAGAFGNTAPLVFSPQHALLIADPSGEERLARATHLARLRGGIVRRMTDCRMVTYVHLMFDRHQILRSHGLWSESFYPGPQALRMLRHPQRNELELLFPDIFKPAQVAASILYGPPARNVMSARDLPDHLRDLKSPS